ncbi:MAG TPA: tetratricopeptide repeat protein [Flavobacteriaceae bacterium]|nr:tetratricopeptide repeat protein [Flavobacteriaceae bacterium]
MKKKILTIALSLATVMAFSQKKEIRNAEDAIEEGNYTEAKSLLKQVESQISEESENTQTDYYLAKAQAYLGANNGSATSMEDLMIAAEAYNKVKELGEEEAADTGIMAVRNALVNSAITDQNNKKYGDAAKKLYKSYQMNKIDTVYLYYAANLSLNGKDYDSALKYYKELMELGYDGSETQFVATDIATGEVKTFSSKEERDLFVKSGEYNNPQTKAIPSKKGEIAKNIALIYIQQDKLDLAKEAMASAKAENPDDIGLLQAEANMYYNLGKVDKYNQLMKEIVKKDPENATLYYNLAVTSAELGDTKGAIEYYKKAIEFDPAMEAAYFNLAATILEKEDAILEQMNKALADGNNSKYDELAAQRKETYQQALPYLEKAKELAPDNEGVLRTMMNIYYVLGNNEKAKEMKTKLDALGK